MSATKYFNSGLPLELESGELLYNPQIAYHTYGTLNEDRSNVIWVCHALTADSDICGWWPGLFGDNCLFNPQDHFMVCANVPGSHYGSTGPLHINPVTQQPYYHLFPHLTIRDMVKAHQLLATHLGIGNIRLLIGGSLGGQQAVEWAIDEPGRIGQLVLIATNAQHSPWGIAFNESQRLAIKADSTYFSLSPDGGSKGLRAARAMALLSYRSYETYQLTQGEATAEKMGDFRAASYQRHQGDKLVKRFNAYSYVALSQAMDSHNTGRGRGSVTAALSSILAQVLVIGIRNDVLFPVAEQQFLARHIRNAVFHEIDSLYGHDGFLLETERLSKLLTPFLETFRPETLYKELIF
jgi:homoserine O-acetyltransferase